jgi:hypothetical protein
MGCDRRMNLTSASIHLSPSFSARSDHHMQFSYICSIRLYATTVTLSYASLDTYSIFILLCGAAVNCSDYSGVHTEMAVSAKANTHPPTSLHLPLSKKQQQYRHAMPVEPEAVPNTRRWKQGYHAGLAEV